MTTIKNRIGHRVINEKGKSLFGFMNDEDGYWTTDFKSHKWEKVSKEKFNEEFLLKQKTAGIIVVKDTSIIRF